MLSTKLICQYYVNDYVMHINIKNMPENISIEMFDQKNGKLLEK